MASKQAHKRLTKEYLAIAKNPPPFFVAKPLESNILEWHYVLTGPPNSPYEGGEYHGTVVFPPQYPYKPPSIKMLTPNGRFKTNYKLCLSMSDYHPDTWNPAWSIATILTGLLSFMLEETETTGSIKTSVRERVMLASSTRAWNRNQPLFCEVFPELVGKEFPKKDETVLISRKPATETKENHSSPTNARGSYSLFRYYVVFGLGLFLYLILSKIVSKIGS